MLFLLCAALMLTGLVACSSSTKADGVYTAEADDTYVDSNGYGWRDSLAVGSLMNARGLMELIVIRIGYDAGLIGPELFTMLFALTLVTTVMASPLLSLLYRGTPWPAPAAAIAPERNA